jgi:hypothetical protein
MSFPSLIFCARLALRFSFSVGGSLPPFSRRPVTVGKFGALELYGATDQPLNSNRIVQTLWAWFFILYVYLSRFLATYSLNLSLKSHCIPVHP